MFTDQRALATAVEALDAITGPRGSTVRVLIPGGLYFDGTVRDRVVAGGRLEAVVLKAATGRLISIPYATVIAIAIGEEPTP